MMSGTKNKKTLAVLLMLLSSLSFAGMGAFVKLSGNIDTFEKAFFRNFVSLIVAALLLAKNHQSAWGKKGNRLMLFCRGFFGTIGMLAYFYGIDHLILADSGMLNKMHPFFVTIFAFLFLKEKFTVHQLVALFISLAGAFFIIKPGFASATTFPAFICFMSAVFAGLAYVFVSYLGDKENSATIVFWFSLISTLITLPLALLHFTLPSALQLCFLVSAGIAAAAGQFCLTIAYRFAPASEVSIFNFSNVVFSSILGIILFSELPDGLSILGYLLIIGAGIIIFKFGSVKKTGLPPQR